MISSLSSTNKQLVFLISCICMVCTLRSSSVAGVAWPLAQRPSYRDSAAAARAKFISTRGVARDAATPLSL